MHIAQQIGPLFFWDGDRVLPSYVIDLAGRLIQRSNQGNRDTLIPFAVAGIDFAFGPKMPTLFELSKEKIEARLRQLQIVKDRSAEMLAGAYPEARVPEVPHFFFPHVTTKVPDTDIEFLIRSIERAGPYRDRDSGISALEEHGIFRMPALGEYNPYYHRAMGTVDSGTRVKELQPGWASSTRIYAKAVVMEYGMYQERNEQSL